ncbi:hypothetical protein ZIOFF_005366 [Zingiber officinale]|uniref:CCHC-type domain-containing protein n=1 Tax=Zingiber officinale TaxID=94328 RepID=A0A8J5LUU1_ZINOF|nr:hypothetical protein ZIOFF_005366 [Zingiber officinale]
MAGRRRKGPNDEDPQARQRNLRDIELEDLRRQVQQLEQRLARGKHREYDVDGHDSDGGSTNNDVDFNPFHDDDSRDRASRGPQFRRDNVRNKSFDFKKDLSVEDYVAEFENLMMRCDVLEPEEQIIARFLGGLRYEIGNVVQLQPYWTYNDVCQLALKVEKQQKESSRFGGRFSSGGGASNRGSASASKNTPAAKDVKQKYVASKDDGAGFVKSSGPTNQKTCFKCKGFGHFAADCPNRRTITFIEEVYGEENEETAPIYDEFDEEEDITYEDHGEALINHHANPKVPAVPHPAANVLHFLSY